MNIQGVGHLQYAESRPASGHKARAAKAGAAKAVFSIPDRVDAAGSPTNRGELLNEVKQKIKSGYYATDSVIDDVSHGFADLLNQY